MSRTEAKIHATFFTGFEPISGLQFHPDVLNKAEKLIERQESQEGRLRNVHEIIYKSDKITRIFAECIPQTKLNQTDYSIKFIVSEDRTVLEANCGCVAGTRGTCKHSAALFLWINKERSETKTDVPQKWMTHSEHLQKAYPKVR